MRNMESLPGRTKHFILLHQTVGNQNTTPPHLSQQIDVLAGELLTGDDHTNDDTYLLYNLNPENPIELQCEANQVKLLTQEEFHLLLPTAACSERLKVFNNWLDEGKSLKIGDKVTLYLGESEMTGKLWFKGRTEDQPGTVFEVELDSPLYHNNFNMQHPQKSIIVPLNKIRKYNLPLQIEDRVVWVTDEGNEKATVRWIGNLDNELELTVGVEFDNPCGTGTGLYKKQRLFKTKPGHASLIPVDGLLKESTLLEQREALATPTVEGPEYPNDIADSPPNDDTVYQLMPQDYGAEDSDGIVDIHNRPAPNLPIPPNDDIRNQKSPEKKGSEYPNDNANFYSIPVLASTSSLYDDIRNQKSPEKKEKAIGVAAKYGRSQQQSSSSSVEMIIPTAKVKPFSDRKEIDHSLETGSMVEIPCRDQPMYGVIRWIGEDEMLAKIVGQEMDNPCGTGTGLYKKERLSKTKPGHASLLPEDGLLKESALFEGAEYPNDNANIYNTPVLALPSPIYDDIENQKSPEKKEKAIGVAAKYGRPQQQSSSSSVEMIIPMAKVKPFSDRKEIDHTLEIGSKVEIPCRDQRMYGVIRWIGEDEYLGKLVGLNRLQQVDPCGTGTGLYKNERLSKTKPGHASLLPVDGLLKESAFFEGD